MKKSKHLFDAFRYFGKTFSYKLFLFLLSGLAMGFYFTGKNTELAATGCEIRQITAITTNNMTSYNDNGTSSDSNGYFDINL